MRRPWILTLVAALCCCSGDEAGADKPLQRDPAPTDIGVHGHANGCFVIEAFDGGRALKFLQATSDGYTWTAPSKQAATPFTMRPSDLGTFLFYDTERRYLSAEKAGDTWRLARVSKLESVEDRLDESFRSPAEWRLQKSAREDGRYQLQHLATERFLSMQGLVDSAAKAAIVTLYPAEGCVAFPELALGATGEVVGKKWPDGDLWGIAEIHSHIFSNAAFGGGGIFHGAPFHRLGVERALPDCQRSHGPDGKRDLMGFFYDNDTKFDLAALLPVATKGQFEEFNHKTDGYPTFSEWPNARKRSTHQTMYYRWLERAWMAGLRLVVQHATGNSVMCDLTLATKAQKTLYSCNDMVSVDRALDRAEELERYIDAQWSGPGRGWFRIVKTPKQAREVVAQGKLAVVLGIEISNLFDCFLTAPKGFAACDEAMVRKKLDHYRSRGVRVVFPVHKYDNGFSPGDGSKAIIEVGNFVNSGHYSNFVQDCPGISTSFDKGEVTFGGINKPRDTYASKAPHDLSGMVDNLVGTLAPFVSELQSGPLKGTWCQKHGMTELGKALLHEMMTRAMIPDVAHLPQRALVDAYTILEKADFPALKTHGSSNKGRIYGLGGMVGTRFGRCQDPAKPGAMMAPIDAHVAEAKAKGAYPAEALSFDLNGFAGAPGPRFGADKVCGNPQSKPITYPFKSVDGAVTFTQPTLGQRKVDFNTKGMIHIGLLPELIEDARNDGATDKELEPVFRSAEAYVRMWEKAEARASALRKK